MTDSFLRSPCCNRRSTINNLQSAERVARRLGLGIECRREALVHSHHHGHHGRSTNWAVKLALGITLALVGTEFVAGAVAHSLALISDGWHNLTDVPTLILAWIAL